MAREMEFRMERDGLIQVGDHVELERRYREYHGRCYVSIIRSRMPLPCQITRRKNCIDLDGTVKSIEASESYWTVTVEIEE